MRRALCKMGGEGANGRPVYSGLRLFASALFPALHLVLMDTGPLYRCKPPSMGIASGGLIEPRLVLLLYQVTSPTPGVLCSCIIVFGEVGCPGGGLLGPSSASVLVVTW